jgi:hypothetical protein
MSGFSDEVIMAAYKQQHKLLESKGFNIKLNIMDNEASTIIKKYLTMKDCNQMLVKPHNHRMNAAERAIQTFKAHFISALATTDSKFPPSTLGLPDPSGQNYSKHVAPVPDRPVQISL